MWTREDAEEWLQDKFTFVETLFTEYTRILYGLLRKPRNTVSGLVQNERVSPYLFYVANITIIALIGGLGDGSESLLHLILNSVVLTVKPTWNDRFWLILSYMVGGALYIFVSKFIARKWLRVEIDYIKVSKALCYASFTFVPISLLKCILQPILLYNMSSIFAIKAAIVDMSAVALCGVAFVVPIVLAILWWIKVASLYLSNFIGTAQRLIVVSLLSYTAIVSLQII